MTVTLFAAGNPVPSAAATDAFGRFRTSDPLTIFSSKLISESQDLFWDDQEVSGSGTSSTWDQDRASVLLETTAATAGKRVRQTFRHLNYQPGKSQLIMMTGIIGSQESGVTAEIGTMTDDNGLFFRNEDGTLSVVRRTNVTGTPVDNVVDQANWNIDTMDGNGVSGITLDPDNAQIFLIDFEWLGAGRVRMGFVIDGLTFYCHEYGNANVLDAVYMSTPNLPLRYSIENDGTAGSTSLEAICSSVISEGGHEEIGPTTYVSNGGTHVDAAVTGTIYALVGIRLKATHLGATIIPFAMSVLSESNDDYEFLLMWNPTVAGTFTYTDVTGSCIQEAIGVSANTVTGGKTLFGGYGAKNAVAARTSPSTGLVLGSAIDGTRDEIVIGARPLSNALDISAGLTVRELL
ncbi:MAG: hypothetical protein GY906_10020 [bacterium]|nr:hypothetical protein [bacterium]